MDKKYEYTNYLEKQIETAIKEDGCETFEELTDMETINMCVELQKHINEFKKERDSEYGFSKYMFLVGQRLEQGDTIGTSNEAIFEEMDYFKDCFESGLGVYKALIMFGFHDEDEDDE